MTHKDKLWLIITYHDSSWHIMTHHDTSWLFIAHPDSIRHIMNHIDISWLIVTHHDSSWLIMTHRVMTHYVSLCLCMTHRNLLGPLKRRNQQIEEYLSKVWVSDWVTESVTCPDLERLAPLKIRSCTRWVENCWSSRR